MQDTYRHKGLRKKLAEEVARKGISDPVVLDAIAEIPRHFFFDKAFLEFAYQDKAFPIGAGQTISQPYTVAFQSELLQVKKGMKVLEVGTGSGYQACVLAKMGAKVFSIERQKELFDKTRPLIKALGYRVQCVFGDGYKGLPSYAPFDRIMITCGAPQVPVELIQQLVVGGRMVVPVGSGATQEMTLIIKDDDVNHRVESHGQFMFVPMLERTEKPK